MNRYIAMIFFISTILFLSLICSNEVSAKAKKNLTAKRIEGHIKLDGFLNDTAWKSAVPLSDFTQRELHEGEEPTEKTEVTVLYDEDKLYIGIVCYDSEPERIIRKELMWDGDIEGDDMFTVVLDTFNDQRSGFVFSTNANGAMYDGLIKNVEEINEDWDGNWEVRGRVTNYGWTAEMVIPFMTLRFPQNGVQNWGINFRRMIRRKNEEVLWTAWSRDDGILQIAKAGQLTGLEGIKRGKRTELKPYVLGALEKDNGDPLNRSFKYGLDVKYPLTSELTLDFTTKTDFAQVESDKERINITRFNMQYPEKRDFFLEGAEIFDFSMSTSNYDAVKLFYSRRIGITPDPDRQEVPILGGVKLSGKAGRYNLGVMSMQTDETYITDDDGNRNYYPSTNYTTARVKRDIFKQSYIGILVTSVNRDKQPDNPLTDNAETDRFMNKLNNNMAALDFAYNTTSFLGDKNFIVQGYLGASQTPGLEDGNVAGRLSVDYPNDLVDIYFAYHSIGNNFNPELGFLRRHGVQEYKSEMTWMPRFNIPFIKKLSIQPYSISYLTDRSARMVERIFEVRPLGFEMENGDEFTLERHWHYDYVDYEYDVFDDIVMKVGGYRFAHWFIRYQSVKSRPVSVDLMYSRGGYMNGKRHYYGAELTYKINRFIMLVPDFSIYDVRLPDRSFIARNSTLRVQTNLSTRLISSTFIQWNNEDHEAAMNFRIHYIPKIGSDLYIAYNQFWDEEDDFRTLYNTGIVKVDYLIRF
ncbi:DUF5916 domain-containing protein [Candidatus Omnitrophota bacterium]